jgi:hypothetical protein
LLLGRWDSDLQQLHLTQVRMMKKQLLLWLDYTYLMMTLLLLMIRHLLAVIIMKGQCWDDLARFHNYDADAEADGGKVGIK